MKKYRMFKFPEDVWNNWNNRKNKIEKRIYEKTGKKKKVPMTDVIRFYGKRKSYIWDEEVINFFMRKKGKKNRGGGVI
jgi:hypothetical protein